MKRSCAKLVRREHNFIPSRSLKGGAVFWIEDLDMRNRKEENAKRLRRKRRIRKKIVGTMERPRLTVYRSNKGIYAQLIDDLEGRTIASAGNNDRQSGAEFADLDKMAQARAVGELLAQRAREKGVEQVVFDRNGFIYHGRIAALAEGAREAGLQF